MSIIGERRVEGAGALMEPEAATELLIPALELYRRVVADPIASGAEVLQMVATARSAVAPDGRGAEALVAALRAQAWFEHARLANGTAKSLLDEAVRIARTHRADERLSEVLLTRAAVNLERGSHAAARRDLDAALVAAGGEPPAEAGLAQASLFYNAGELDAAAVLCRRVLADPTAPPELRAKVANNLAMIDTQRGRPFDALARLDEADALAAGSGPGLRAGISSTRAWVLAHAGRLAESLDLFDEAERRYRDAGLPTGELVMEQLDALVDLRLIPEALASAVRAVREFTQHDVALMAADARLRLAQVELLAGAVPAALETAALAAAGHRAQRRPGPRARAQTVVVAAALRLGTVGPAELAAARRAASTLQRLGQRAAAVEANLVAGRAAVALGRSRVAQEHLGTARALARSGTVLVRLRGRLAAALAAQDRGDPADVARHGRAGLADLSRHRAALGSAELRALASGHGAELGRVALHAVLRSAGPAAVLGWMERTRAAAQLVVAPDPQPAVQAGLAALHAVQAELDAARLAGHGESRRLLARLAVLETEVRRTAWKHSSPIDPGGRPVPVPQARRALGDRVLVAFGVDGGVDGDRMFAVVLTARATRLVPLGPVADVTGEADALLFALRRSTRPGPARSLSTARASAEHAIGRLRSMLLDPLRLGPDVPLVVVPDATTRALPWSALHDAPLTVAPSVSSWVRSLVPPGLASGVVLVAGPDLAGAGREVAELAGLYPDATVLAPPASTVPVVMSALAGADLAHLGCHGLLRRDNPTFSALRLCGGDLTLHALGQLGAAPRRVVLAACDSANGFAYDGTEVLGFVGALMARGAVAVAANSAPVGDLESVTSSVGIHRALRAGATMAEAVHTGRAGLDRADPRQFVSWCVMTAFGGG